MAGISIGSVSVAVVPDARLFSSTLRTELLPEADTLGQDIGARIAAGINTALHDVGLDVAANTEAADAALAETGKLSDELGKQAPVITPEANTEAANKGLEETKGIADKLGADSPVITPEVDTAAAIAKLTALAAESGKAADAAKYAYAAQTLLAAGEKAAGDSATAAVPGVAALGAAANSTITPVRNAYGAYSLLTKQITLWGGALGDTHMIGEIALWHIALDGVLESSIALAAATISLSVGLAAMAAPSLDIYNHLMAVSEVNDALGTNIPPLTGKFQQLSQAMAPQTVEIYGGALNVLNGNSGALARTVGQVVGGLDDLIAKIDLWSAAQAHSGGILEAGVGFLHQFEVVLGEVFTALDDVVKADPGTAHYLMDVVEVFGKLLDVVLSIPSPLLQATLALHGFMLWGGLLGTMVAKMASPFISLGQNAISLAGRLGLLGEASQAAAIPLGDLRNAENAAAAEADTLRGKLLTLAANPMVWVVAAAAAVAYLGYEMLQASSSAKSFISSLDESVAGQSASQAIVGISSAIGQLNGQISLMSSSGGIKQIQSSWTDLGHTGQSLAADTRAVGEDFGKALEDLNSGKIISGYAAVARGLEGIIVPGQGAAVVAKNNIDAYAGAIVKLTGQQNNLFSETGNLVKQGYNFEQALGLMDLAGVKAGDSLDLMRQKVDNLITGYQNMSVRGGLLSNSVSAITLASEQQDSKVTALTQGWTAFITLVTGSETAFGTFETQMQGLSTAATTVANQLSVSSGKAHDTTKAAGDATTSLTGATISMNGLSTASLQLRNTWQGAITDGSQLINTLITQASAAGLGAKGTQLLAQGGRDVISMMLPLAKGSAEATAELYALAQQAGYQGADSFKALSAWVGKTHDAEGNLNAITSKLTVASAGLTTDVQNLAAALQQNLNTAMAAAILQANGGQKAFDQFATAVVKNKSNIDADKSSATTLAQELITLTGNTGQAQSEFVTMSQKLGLTKTQADQLWNSASRLAGEMTVSHPARTTMITDLANIGLRATTAKTDVDGFNTMIQQNGGKITAAQAARSALIQDIIKTGQHAHDTTGQIATMITKISGIPKSEALKIVETAEGSYSIKTSVVSGSRNASGAFEPGAQAGWRVPGYGGGDIVPIMVEPGETIVPKHLTPAVAPLMKKHNVPGFETGGYVGNGGAGTFPGLGDFAVKSHTALVNDTAKALISAMNTAIKSAQAAATASSAQYTGKYGAGVNQWRPDVLKVLSMLGLPASLAGRVLYQMQTESGGNPNAINNWDSNAAAGDPSRGLLQTIMSTFEAYRSPSLPNNIYDPMANIYAAVNYAMHEYGPSLMSGGKGMGSGHGYDSGGWMPPGLTLALNGTGRPEPVLTGRQWDMISSAVTGGDGAGFGSRAMHKKFDRMIDLLERAPGRTAGGLGQALNGTARGAVQRAVSRTR